MAMPVPAVDLLLVQDYLEFDPEKGYIFQHVQTVWYLKGVNPHNGTDNIT